MATLDADADNPQYGTDDVQVSGSLAQDIPNTQFHQFNTLS